MPTLAMVRFDTDLDTREIVPVAIPGTLFSYSFMGCTYESRVSYY